MKNVYLFVTIFFIVCYVEVLAQLTWTQKANHLNAARYDFAGFSINNKGYIGGGRFAGPFNSLSEWQEFNPITNTWTLVTPMPYPYTGLSAFEVGGYGYVTNGVNSAFYDYDTYRYNHLGNNWATLSAMTYPRLYSACTSNGVKGYVICGYGFSAEPLSDLWEYDPVLDTWTEKDTLPSTAARYYATAFSISGNIYLFGGVNDTACLNDLWKYTPATDQWTQMTSLPSAGREQCLSVVLNNEAYIIGGIPWSGPDLKEVWKYNASTDSWLQLANFPGVNAPFGGTAFTINGKGYIVPGNGTTECWELDPGSITSENENNLRSDFLLFPNPVSNKLHVIGISANAEIQIYNWAGEKIPTSSFRRGKNEIDVKDFPAGIYSVRILDKEKLTLKKFLKL